jgi:aspartyl-tRNA(Asn)/glutamyl-tRNA(Gln) amidotransferase subunit A
VSTVSALRDLDLVDATAGLARGEFAARELVEAALEAAAGVATLRAFSFLAVDEAREAADAATDRRRRGEPLSPLDGVPVAVKANVAVEGWPWTAGLRALAARRASQDAFVVARVRRLGAIPIGLTTLDEAALGASGHHPWDGPTGNPRAPGRSVGGSSSGSAAAVAACVVPLAIGTDTIGSIRIPAAFCGVVGLKPSFGLVSTRGVEPVHPRFDHVGPIVRRARDLPLALEAMAAYDREHPVAFPVALGTPGGSQDRLRIGVIERVENVELDTEVAAALARAVSWFDRAGHAVVRIDTGGWELARVRRAILALAEVETWRRHRAALAATPEDFSPGLREMLAYGATLRAPDLERNEGRIAAFYARVQSLFARHDLLICATTPSRAFAWPEPPPDGIADLTAIASATGWPAVSVPAPCDDGLPAGIQLVGPPGSDRRLARVAEELEVSLRR